MQIDDLAEIIRQLVSLTHVFDPIKKLDDVAPDTDQRDDMATMYIFKNPDIDSYLKGTVTGPGSRR